MNDTYYSQLIYQWLQNSGLSGSTSDLITYINQVDLAVDGISDKVSSILEDLISILDRLDLISGQIYDLLFVGLFGVMLWFAMQFVQKRWYTS